MSSETPASPAQGSSEARDPPAPVSEASKRTDIPSTEADTRDWDSIKKRYYEEEAIVQRILEKWLEPGAIQPTGAKTAERDQILKELLVHHEERTARAKEVWENSQRLLEESRLAMEEREQWLEDYEKTRA